MKHFLIYILSLMYITTQAQRPVKTTATNKLKSDFSIYTDAPNSFSLTYPNTWKIRVTDSSEKSKVFVKTPSEGINDLFNENINVMVRFIPNAENLSAKDFQQSIKTALEDKLKNYTLLNDKIIKWNGVDAYHIEYKATQKSGEVEIDLQIMQRLVLKKNYLYTVTYTATQNSSKIFYDQAAEIVNSFKIK